MLGNYIEYKYDEVLNEWKEYDEDLRLIYHYLPDDFLCLHFNGGRLTEAKLFEEIKNCFSSISTIILVLKLPFYHLFYGN